MAIQRGKVKLSATEQKSLVMREAGWSSKQYQREYDKLRNRARNYERATGLKRGEINVADLLARDVHYRHVARQNGYEYKPTELYSAISRTTSASPGRPLSETVRTRIERVEFSRIERQFRGVIENSIYSDRIRASVERAKRTGEYSVSWYRDLVEGYAELLGGSKKALLVINKGIEDRSKKIEWDSK